MKSVKHRNKLKQPLDRIANDPVAKHMRTFNKAHVMVDRKKAKDRGYTKHKGAW